MPIYEYQCEACQHTFERLTFKGDKEPANCPQCNSPDVKKLLSASSFMNGSGLGGCATGSAGKFS